MSAKHVEQFKRAFEPAAYDAADEANLPLAVMAELSTAISLKRIADALWGDDGTSGLLQLLNPLDVRNNY